MIVPRVVDTIRPSSVLDVGAGGGTWLKAWANAGVKDLRGIDIASPEDSDYVMPYETYTRISLEHPFDLGRRFSLVQCLEVAEHLAPQSASGLVGTLCRHADIILFSAAPRGQGGVHHVNEQDFGYWRELFAQNRYWPVDWLRPQLVGEHEVAWWYRYNMLLYANDTGLAALPPQIRAAHLANGTPIADIAPIPHRIRRAILRPLPWRLVTWLAKAGERFSNTSRS